MSFSINRRVVTSVMIVFLAMLVFDPRISAQSSDTRYLPAIKSRAEFDSLSRSYDADTPYPLPHVLFVIDRKDNNKIYYANAKRYTFHKDFVNGNYLSLERLMGV